MQCLKEEFTIKRAKIKIFNKILLTYTIAIIFTLLSLAFFVQSSIQQAAKKNELELNKKILDRMTDYFNEKCNHSKELVMSLYRNEEQSSDLIFFLRNSIDAYSAYRLDKFYGKNTFIMQGMFTYLQNCFLSDPKLKSIILYSKEKDFLYISEADNYVNYLQKNEVFTLPPNADLRIPNFDIINAKPRQYVLGNPKENNQVFSTIQFLNNPTTLKTIGYIIFNYDLEPIANYCRQYNNEENGYILALTPKGDVFFDSSNKYYSQRFPYIDLIKSLTNSNTVRLDEECYINTSDNGVLLIGVIPKSKIINITKHANQTIFFIAGLLIIAVVFLMYIKLKSLQKRTDRITSAMKKIQSGDLSVRIPHTKDNDELTLIATSFNHMCSELNNYINRMYLSELKQKNAELVALQNQINPHFLYNTLESIRMRAVAKGATDIGNMIYILATLFKSSVKNKTIITIAEELHYCQLYLQLFKIRHTNKFTYDIKVNEEILNYKIIKFTLQPIIENYIVHGICLERTDNYISIKGSLSKETIEFEICDNGKGIEESKLESLRSALHHPEQQPSATSSAGLTNVHERLFIMYGREYGITINSKQNKGTCVQLKIPVQKGAET
ncbi:MAG TPA: hypothetical protein DDZ91_06705 [Firmicutes bacterium]|jgi:two-component system sensor histidine kinase YesM|nr:hypothetical protein [Bacillota bacterium]